jgi:SnoaL-like domain
MRRRLLWLLASVPVLLLFAVGHTLADEPKDKATEEAALLKNAETFVEAFHKGDAKAVAALWTKDGDYTDQTGRTFKGRDAIEKGFTEFLAATQILTRVDDDTLTWESKDRTEDGKALPDVEPIKMKRVK